MCWLISLQVLHRLKKVACLVSYHDDDAMQAHSLGNAIWENSMKLLLSWDGSIRRVEGDPGLFFAFLSCLCVRTTKFNACGFVFAFSCKIASRFKSTYLHSSAPCLYFEHGLWAISTRGPAKPQLANHLLERMKLSASWLPQAQLYLTAPAGGLH